MTAAACSLPILLFCSDEYNPFTDASNTRMYIAGSFGHGDTIELFSAETLTVMLSVPELADTFSVSSETNRLFEQGRKVFAADRRSLRRGPYELFFSMYDTGWQNIVFTLRRAGGEVTERTVSCFVRSPLAPEVVHGSYGASVALITGSVGDRDVLYKWNFGRGMVVTTTKPETTAVVYTSGVDHAGRLSVSDGYVASPEVAFEYALVDSVGPVVKFLDELYVRSGDTIITPDTMFLFRVVIKDRGPGGVDSASLNGVPFDLVDDTLYTKIFNRMDTVLVPQLMTLYAMDNFQYRNDTTLSFLLRFDPNVLHRSGLRLRLWVPPRDSTVFSVATKKLLGTLEHVAGDSIHARLRITVNGKTIHNDSLSGKGSVDWASIATFPDSVNLLGVTAYNSDGDSVAGIERVVIVEESAVDNLPPVIVAVLANGENANGLSIDARSVPLRIFAFDAGEGVDRILVNEKSADSENGVAWTCRALLEHKKGGEVFTIKVIDKAGLSADTSVILYNNTRPVPVYLPVPPIPLFTGTEYVDSFIVQDLDGDSLIYSIAEGNADLTISARGIIRWTPEVKDTGINTFQLNVYDGYDEIIHRMQVMVIEKSNLRPPVAFRTTEEAFPLWVEATRDTILVKLQTKDGTGMEPFTFEAVRSTDGRKLPLYGDTLRFSPALQDTGRLQMRITVTDHFRRADTLFPAVTIVPPNRPCHLVQIAGFDTLPDGRYDASALPDRDTLVFQIDDPDIALVEEFRAGRIQGGDRRMLVVDAKRQFTVVISGSDRTEGTDTVVVTVSDRAGHSDSIPVMVYYGTPPDTPVLAGPAVDSTVADSVVRFSWSGNDSDGYVRFTLLAGMCPGPLDTVATGLNESELTIAPVRTSGRYCWQVVATDGKSSVKSAVNAFRVRFPNHVAFITGEADFPAALEALRDTLSIQLELKTGTGTAPFTFSAFLDGADAVGSVDANTFTFVPSVADIGRRKLIITVTDANRNSDTLLPEVLVVPPNRPCSLAIVYDGVWNDDGSIDLSSTVEPDSLQFRVIDPDTSLVEQFSVTIKQLNLVENGVLDANRTISIILDPGRATSERDTVTVTVEDRAGHTASESVGIYYGVK